MMKFSVCIDALFMGKDFTDSMKSIKDAGIDTLEFWCWWDKDLDKIKETAGELNMNISAFCTKFISLVDALKREEYIEGLKESIEAAKKLGCSKLITQAGDELTEITREEQHKNIVEGLKACAPILENEGITLLVEPLNTLVDHKGYYLYSSDEAFQIIDEVGSGNVKVLYDIYHQQIMEGNLINQISKNIDKIGHFHAAGNPGRHELNIGEIYYTNVFKVIEQAGYSDYIGLEYFPLEDAAIGLRELI